MSPASIFTKAAADGVSDAVTQKILPLFIPFSCTT